MKNLIFFALLLAFLFFNTLGAQSNLLNAKVPQEVGQMNEQQIEAENADAFLVNIDSILSLSTKTQKSWWWRRSERSLNFRY